MPWAYTSIFRVPTPDTHSKASRGPGAGSISPVPNPTYIHNRLGFVPSVPHEAHTCYPGRLHLALEPFAPSRLAYTINIYVIPYMCVYMRVHNVSTASVRMTLMMHISRS